MTDAGGRGAAGAPRRPSRPAWRDVDGIVVVDKPVGMTSNAVLQRVRRLYRARKAGHTGSLDPLASGVLPLCFGEATKLSGLLLDAAKAYEVTGRLGVRTATGDAEGETLETAPVPGFGAGDIEAVLAKFRGEIEQVPPMYSALKQDGRRLYDLARAGQTVERPPRRVTIHGLDLLAWSAPDLSLLVRCSKGTYIRTLVEDIGAALGTCAHVVRLRRVAAGPFRASDSVGLDVLEAAAKADGLRERLLPADAGVPDLPAVHLSDGATRRLRQGQPVPLPGSGGAAAGPCKVYDAAGRFVGLGEAGADGRLVPRRLFRVRGEV